MTLPRGVHESLFCPKAGGEIEARYTYEGGQVHILQVFVGHAWVIPERVLLPHVIQDAQAEMQALQVELAGEAEDDRELQRFREEVL